MSNSSIWPVRRTLLGATPPGQNGPGSNGNGGVLRIPKRSSVRVGSPSDCLMLYPGHSLWAGEVLLLCRGAIGVFYSLSLPYYLPISERRKTWIHASLKWIRAKWNLKNWNQVTEFISLEDNRCANHACLKYAEMQSVYSTAPPRSRLCCAVGVFCHSS